MRELITKGFRRTAKAVYFPSNSPLTINGKKYNEYFSDIFLSKQFCDNVEKFSIGGRISIAGGGPVGQYKAMIDALLRAEQKSDKTIRVKTDPRTRRRSRVGYTGPNSQKPHNRR